MFGGKVFKQQWDRVVTWETSKPQPMKGYAGALARWMEVGHSRLGLRGPKTWTAESWLEPAKCSKPLRPDW